MKTTSISTAVAEDHGSVCRTISDFRSFPKLPKDIVVMILEKLELKDLRTIRETCKDLGTLGTHPLFCDHIVNFDEIGMAKFEEMSKNSSIASSVKSVTICPLRLFPPNEQSDRNNGMSSMESWTSVHFGRFEGGSLSTALSNLTQCEKIALKDLNGPRISDPKYLSGSVPLTTFAKGLIEYPLREAMTSRIKMKQLEIRIGSLQAHPRFIALDMLPDSSKVYNDLRRLHISIDSNFNDPIQLQTFLKAFPELSDFSLQVSSTVFRTKSPGVLKGLNIPMLERLSLDAVECTATELEGFLFHHTETLRKVNLIRISSIPNTQSWPNKIRNSMRLRHFSTYQCPPPEEL